MKRVVRLGVFESNSSSTHVLQILIKKDYDDWISHNKYLYGGSGWGWKDDKNKPKQSCVYSKEEVIAFLKSSKYPPDEDTDWEDEEVVDEWFEDNEFYNSDYYFENDRYEFFKETYTTSSGEEVVAFGYYGFG